MRRLVDLCDLLKRLWQVYRWKILQPPFLAEALRYASGRQSMTEPRRLKRRKIRLPEDEGPHDCVMEWWYLNGRLRSKTGRDYAFMHTRFRLDLRCLPVSDHFRTQEVISSEHFILFDLATNSTVKRVEVTSGEADRLQIVNEGRYKLSQPELILDGKAVGKPLFVNGTGVNRFPVNPSFYYSRPRVDLAGSVVENGRTINVTGRGWLDHQWLNVSYQRFRWNWFSLTADDGTAMMLVDYGVNSNQQVVCFRDRHGAEQTLERAYFEPLQSGRYPLAWHLVVPEIELDITTTALVSDGEMSIGFYHYCEVPVRFAGKIGQRRVSGKGFMEIVVP